ncbi:DUF4974 domain-containing protein [Olivibacter sp. CPCC 100613]|uniref:FecR family protein n=1 Tax=Olivibacter sp. CPCC 100613 TaxID=3079931 RepID=UPI002FF69AB8
MTEEEIKLLLERYYNGLCTDDEKKWVETWLAHVEKQSDWSWSSRLHAKQVKQRIAGKIEKRVSTKLLRRAKITYYWLAAMAASFLLIGVGIVLWPYSRTDQLPTDHVIALPEQVDAARLTMYDGTVIDLTTLEDGIANRAGSATIKKGKDNSLVYTLQDRRATEALGEKWNTLLIPAGTTYQLVLPDGSKVWLNACSELSFSSVFGKGGRQVRLKGEAYFEVAPQAQYPFTVEANGSLVSVMGTAFNVSAYPDEKEVLTTLAEGAVAVSLHDRSLVLQPGEQASAHLDKGRLAKSQVDPEVFLAWKNDYFVFDDLDVKAIMHQISRWYNIEVVFQGPIPVKKIGGTFSRTKPLEELLNYLERLGNLHFTLEKGSYFKKERRIIVMP